MNNNDPNLSQPNPSSAPAANAEESLQDWKVEMLKKMPVEQVINSCQSHKDKFQSIHENIISTYMIKNTISEGQLDVLEAFLLQNAPELFENQSQEVAQAQ